MGKHVGEIHRRLYTSSSHRTSWLTMSMDTCQQHVNRALQILAFPRLRNNRVHSTPYVDVEREKLSRKHVEKDRFISLNNLVKVIMHMQTLDVVNKFLSNLYNIVEIIRKKETLFSFKIKFIGKRNVGTTTIIKKTFIAYESV